MRFLVELCEEIQQTHPHGARVTICSDGRVFNDLVGVEDEDVMAYRREIERLIEQTGVDFIDTFDLDDIFSTDNHHASRLRLVEQCAEPLETVIDRAGRFDHHRALFNTHGEEQWITPWHGCVLLDDQRYTLVPRKHAEDLGAHLVTRDGRVSHYEL